MNTKKWKDRKTGNSKRQIYHKKRPETKQRRDAEHLQTGDTYTNNHRDRDVVSQFGGLVLVSAVFHVIRVTSCLNFWSRAVTGPRPRQEAALSRISSVLSGVSSVGGARQLERGAGSGFCYCGRQSCSCVMMRVSGPEESASLHRVCGAGNGPVGCHV